MARAMREVTICDFDDQLATTTINFTGPDGRTHQLDVCEGALREFVRRAYPSGAAVRPGVPTSRRPSPPESPRVSWRLWSAPGPVELVCWNPHAREQGGTACRRATHPSSARRSSTYWRPDDSVTEVAEDLGISGACIYIWRKQDRIDRGELPGLSTTERAELTAVRRRINALEAELAVERRAKQLLKEAVPPEGRFAIIKLMVDEGHSIKVSCRVLRVIAVAKHIRGCLLTEAEDALVLLLPDDLDLVPDLVESLAVAGQSTESRARLWMFLSLGWLLEHRAESSGPLCARAASDGTWPWGSSCRRFRGRRPSTSSPRWWSGSRQRLASRTTCSCVSSGSSGRDTERPQH
jgi:hypothetical protein